MNVTVVTPSGSSNPEPYSFVSAPTLTSVSPNSGPMAGGTLVTITGTGLAAVTSLGFGAYGGTGGSITPGTIGASSFIVHTATKIEVDSPAYPFAGALPTTPSPIDIYLDTAGGMTQTTSADKFTYVPLPTITGMSPTSGSTQGGTKVTITGTNLGNMLSGLPAVNFGNDRPATDRLRQRHDPGRDLAGGARGRGVGDRGDPRHGSQPDRQSGKFRPTWLRAGGPPCSRTPDT